ncbi:MAG: HAD hydrolase-like protein [Deltaproteobacteria bacterium]|nr:HAD hydrolase-like protein [Deltaproteobacteria bacterium]MBN2673790.1 HAD hydrolase-like protein [Deltaproteobacteria bacterium]
MFIAFDLDGTLADPSDGVTNGINHTLERLGLPRRPKEDLLHYIGPPTEWIFGDILQTTDMERINRARSIFTEYYRTTGYRHNFLYADSLSLVQSLNEHGHHLVVVTSKSESGAKAAAAHFRLADYFSGVFGRINDCSKIDSLRMALTTSDTRPAVMIGDRKFDIEAGRTLDCLTVGVTYGFGTVQELTDARADHIVHSQTELLTLLQTL